MEPEIIRHDPDTRRKANLEALGQLASGMAHNINNVLTAVTGQLELCLLDAVESGLSKEMIARIESAMQSSYNGSELCSGVLSFAGKGRDSVADINLNNSCRRMVQLVQAGLGPGIRLETSLNAENPFVRAPGGRLENIVLNLILNSKDAINNNGIIYVSTSNTLIEKGHKNSFGFLPGHGPHTVITVSDTGSGITEENRKRLFEPYFTTKGANGTGIGLASVKEILQLIGGFAEVYSSPGQGTQFIIYLPTIIPADIKVLEDNSPRLQSSTVKGKALVIDDEEVVLEVFRGMFTYLGYEVTACSDPREAIALYRHCHNDYGIVLFDMSMPHLSGMDCWNQIRHVNPQARIIVTSGYGRAADIESIIKDGNASFLEKPFQIQHLEEIIENGVLK
ncbi:MAG: response regulator [Fibrobacteres bacterium]|nr:response regulator [Fibrobacterota bacterium]